MRINGETIYLWRSMELTKDLALGRVTERQKAIYLLADLILVYCLLYIFTPPQSSSAITFGEGVIALLIAVLGVFVSYRNNGGSTGKRFLDHFLCLALPVFLRANVIVWSIYAIFFHLTGIFLDRLPEEYYPLVDLVDDLVTSGAIVAALGLFFLSMAAHIKKVRQLA
jgi:bacteriorhodopsin